MIPCAALSGNFSAAARTISQAAFRRRHLVFLVLDVTFHSIVKLTVATTNTVFVKRLSRGYYEARGRVAILLPAGLLKSPANLPFS
jgi:hypothetical protein